MNKPASVYIHFPFCKSKCLYCTFNSITDLSLKEKYINKLLEEISNTKINSPIDTIYFGGGTPSLMSEDEIKLLVNKLKEKNKKVVSVISGGNIDVLMISSMINKGLIRRDRIFSFSVDISDKPGELAKVVDLIAELGANVVKLEHNQFKNLSRFRDVEVQITVETNGTEHIQNLIETFEQKGYEIIKIKTKIN